jgi:H/ACA ribonucleoprotein complex subunit 2
MLAVLRVLRTFRILVLAGDITPLDIISHLPLLAEEASIPYVFVASKEELGHASSTKRPTSCVMLCPDSKVKRKKKEGEDSKEDEAEFKTSYAKCFSEIKDLVSCKACDGIFSLLMSG